MTPPLPTLNQSGRFAASVAIVSLLWAACPQSSAQTSLTIGTLPGYPGATISVPVVLRQSGNAVSAQFDVAFDSGKVSALDALRGSRLTNQVIRSRLIAPGVERVVIYSLNNSTVARTNETVANLPFNVSPTEHVGSGPLVPANAVLAKADATAIAPVSLNSGIIYVRAVNRLPDGTVQFFLPSEPGTRYLIQATTNFVNWVNLTNTTALGNFMDLVDSDAASYPFRFYRWILYDTAAGELGSVTQLPGGGLSFLLTGLSGRTYILQGSADLQNWTDLRTNVAVTGTLSFTNQISPAFPQRFFRMKSE